MLVTLTDDEIREALVSAAIKKVKMGFFSKPSTRHDCYFEVKARSGEVEDIESVRFIIDFSEQF